MDHFISVYEVVQTYLLEEKCQHWHSLGHNLLGEKLSCIESELRRKFSILFTVEVCYTHYEIRILVCDTCNGCDISRYNGCRTNASICISVEQNTNIILLFGKLDISIRLRFISRY
jgi:hypothetical protein